MSLLFVTDIHFDNYRPFSKITSGGMNSRLLDQLEVVKKVATVIERDKPEAVFFLGDFFNGFMDSLPKIIYNAGFLTAQLWSKHTQLYILVGNHDVYRGMHTFSAFESLPNVHIIAETTKVSPKGIEVDCVPWGCAIPEKKGDVCVGHLEVYGAYMDVAYMCKTGIKPSEFEGYRYVLLGHFHNPQEFKVPGAKEARYIGAVMQVDRRKTSDSFSGVVRLEDDTLVAIPIESPRICTLTINTQEELTNFLYESGKTEDYYKVIIKSKDVIAPKVDHRYSIEYDLPEIVTGRLVLDNPSSDWDTQVAEATEMWIRNSNTVLDKDKLVILAKEML